MNIIPISPTESFRVEEYTDNKAGAIVRMVPILQDGSDDPMRYPTFTGKTFMQTPQGGLEIKFPLVAKTLSQAFVEWAPALQAYLELMQEQGQAQALRAKLINGAHVSPMEARQLAKMKKQ